MGTNKRNCFSRLSLFGGQGGLVLVDSLQTSMGIFPNSDRTQTSMNRSPALCTLLLPVPLLLLSEWKLDYPLSEICKYYVLYFDAFCSSISTQWMTSSANVVLLQLTSVYLSDYSRKFRRKGLSVKFTFLLVSLESGAFI